ncbi:hypothetical protein B0H14DRAFT_2687316 [Mycena olivaceomarginata]|nr:hypothetical protein B0H14DRAFT_2777051 [Mycena olivaceomarginata]KAJ7892108.1 hypothetical protein B0H14DRAFT_2687316 [Mycena olivaceomarginata]
MSDRRKELVKDWIRAKLHRQFRAPNPNDPAISPPGPGTQSTTDLRVGHANSMAAESVIDNIPVVLELVGQITTIAEKAPFIGPIAALVSGILKAYNEAKDTDEKRDMLFTHITNLWGDLCAVILRMETTQHIDLIERLKVDMEAYADLLERASVFIKRYDKESAAIRLVARGELAKKMTALNQELNSFGARFANNRLIDLALQETGHKET